MKILRRGRTADEWAKTDLRKPRDYTKNWRPGRPIPFDGTIDKSGQRHTTLGVVLEHDDVLALHMALIKDLQNKSYERDELEGKIRGLEEVFFRVMSIAKELSSDDETTEAKLREVERICDHYWMNLSDQPFKPEVPAVKKRWRKWP